jgi:hypothetical protein
MAAAPITDPPFTEGTVVDDEFLPHHESGESVHVYQPSGIREGNAALPLWFVVTMVALIAFHFWYMATQWNAQTSSARLRHKGPQPEHSAPAVPSTQTSTEGQGPN